MLKEYVSHLKRHLDEMGFRRAAKAALGVLACAGLLNAIFDTSAFRTTALGASALVNLSVLLVLTKQNTHLRREVATNRDMRNYIRTQTPSLWRIDYWEEKTTIAANGDAVGSVVIRAMVEREDIPFFRFCLGPKWDQPEKERRRVKLTVNPEEGGAKWKTTQDWLPDGRLEVITHLGSAPPKKGDELRFQVAFTWPGKAVPLMRDRGPDEFVTEMRRPLAHFSYTFTLPTECKVGFSPIGLREGVHDFKLWSPTDSPHVVRLIARDMDADHKFGLRLDLK